MNDIAGIVSPAIVEVIKEENDFKGKNDLAFIVQGLGNTQSNDYI